ncbi:hypothetical protein EVAR_13237_1 [Eumeta japonica]|uniref:Uncharacterized protein n=1 Tax=Eumeta variegata TaxID=151549 RepID=A0A4C1TS91_EUMVA|nr:hypothetical protein EVAR_13237_1 [Eumeta japonica]
MAQLRVANDPRNEYDNSIRDRQLKMVVEEQSERLQYNLTQFRNLLVNPWSESNTEAVNETSLDDRRGDTATPPVITRILRGKCVSGPPESRRSPPLMDTSTPRGVTNALPAFQKETCARGRALAHLKRRRSLYIRPRVLRAWVASRAGTNTNLRNIFTVRSRFSNCVPRDCRPQRPAPRSEAPMQKLKPPAHVETLCALAIGDAMSEFDKLFMEYLTPYPADDRIPDSTINRDMSLGSFEQSLLLRRVGFFTPPRTSDFLPGACVHAVRL